MLTEYTVREIFEAIEKNGFEWVHGIWFTPDRRGACVLGQAALNLRVIGNLGIIGVFSGTDNKFTLEAQLNRWAYRNKKWRYVNVNVRQGLADTITYWNDLRYGDTFFLKTYKEAVAMAEEVLRPYMDKKVILRNK